MKRIIYYSIPTLLILSFVIFLNSGVLLKQPMGENDQFNRFLTQIKSDIQANKWDEAKDGVSRLKSAWKVVAQRIQFTTERDELINLENTLARLDGAIQARDRSISLVNINEVASIWEQLGK